MCRWDVTLYHGLAQYAEAGMICNEPWVHMPSLLLFPTYPRGGTHKFLLLISLLCYLDVDLELNLILTVVSLSKPASETVV